MKGARKCGSKRDKVRPVADKFREDHFAQTKPYEVSDVMADLLDVAARSLVMNGRLVYVIPSMLDFDFKVDLPRHPCLEITYCCYQPLSSELGRRIVTMKKVKDYDETKRLSYMEACWVNGPDSANKCARIREKLLESAKQKPGYERKLAERNKKRKARKVEMKKAKILAKQEKLDSCR